MLSIIWRSARKVLNMQITPRPESSLGNALRAAPELCLTQPPLKGPPPYQSQ